MDIPMLHKGLMLPRKYNYTNSINKTVQEWFIN